MFPQLQRGAWHEAVHRWRHRDLDEAIGADNAVRVVDALVDALDLAELGFGMHCKHGSVSFQLRPLTSSR